MNIHVITVEKGLLNFNFNLGLQSLIRMNIVYFTKNWPCRTSTSTIERSLSLLETLINSNNQVTVCSDDLDSSKRQTIDQYPITIVDINPRKVNTSLSSIRSKPNMFIFDSVATEEKYSALLYNKWNQCARILDLTHLPRLEKWRKMNYSMLPNVLVPQNCLMAPKSIDQIFEDEQIRAINRCDYVFTANQFVQHLFAKHLRKDRLALIANGYSCQDFQAQIENLEYRPYEDRKNFIFFANLTKQSNKDAMYCLIQEVWPLIHKALPQVQLHIYGIQDGKAFKGTKQELREKGIFFQGFMEDLENISKYRALLCPIRSATGLRAKISESFFAHLPVVTTPVGAEGFFKEARMPEFSMPLNLRQNSSFSEERQFSSEELLSSKKLQDYYNNQLYTSKISQFSFGGSCGNFTVQNFAENAIKIYEDAKYWNESLKIGQQTLLKNLNEVQVMRNVKRALVKAEIAVYEGRGKGAYEDEWRRYSRSAEFHKRLKS